MGTFGKRLRQALTMREMTQTALAQALGMSQGSISDMVERDQPSKHVFQIAHVLQVQPEWLATGSGEMLLPELGEARVSVPHYDIRLSAGPGAIVTEEAKLGEFTCPIGVLGRFGPTSHAYAFVTADGDSMVDTIRDGELLLVDVSVNEPRGPGVYVVLLAEETMVKRLQRMDGRLYIRSDNRAYDPICLTGEQINDVRVLGRVRAVLRSIGGTTDHLIRAGEEEEV